MSLARAFEHATSSPVVLRPGCKVNVNLAIKGVHQDGYHELDSLFVPMSSPCDTLTITRNSNPGLKIVCSIPELAGTGNILHATHAAWSGRVGYTPGLVLYLEKNIPMGGGLGGGSSDAAALLQWLNQTAGKHGLGREELAGLARELGADVPFFLVNHPCRARGRGDRLEPVDIDLAAYHGLIICPQVHVATAWAYKAWDERWASGHREKKSSRILTMYSRADRNPSSRRHLVLYNDFESVVFPAHPSLYRLKLAVIAMGACGCVMSGSGASLVAFFQREQDRERVCTYLRARSVSVFT
ncbi:4-diphosphocytidyl-2-C-methyl-D-erythritol kinase [Desulfoplanes formicivorans]|uniref:4-diphosphocytidyl-2-C-methyl-D-erythritol kinase n=2 Tax=Desulfoplanes formicivorans TaxID=1592317 RepID=A0A194AKJ0_9BACT|nr:4-diphosphocytidyl-2-C-methyl-D-erythritol kinase [Desulfoplanes formicivorans]